MTGSIPDLSRASTQAEFAACLRALATERKMTYRALAEAAQRLPPRAGRPVALPRSTASDILTGKRMPSAEKLHILLTACGLNDEEQRPWTAAWQRITDTTSTPDEAPGQRCPHTRPRLVGLVALTALLSGAATVLALWAFGAFGHVRTLGPQRLVVVSRNWTHTTPDAKDATHTGDVGPGPRWFSCWTHGEWLDALGHSSDVWVATTNDAGRPNVYISVDYLYQNDPQDLPPCP